MTYNSFFLASTKCKTFTANGRIITSWKLTQIFLKITRLDDLLIKGRIEMSITNYVLADGLVLVN
jgi:hypothetical protein